ncbi:hypothetical protein ONE63_004248 [Megalurothrips usitatus]|uniref:Uncharacterized protein n=1 Tax=Megalurothrips usitatus TaxID=439358 RepID=A0AAV7X285_9NEOP|nr:hypothetical protein ONE63_004248 [Megalurothrips usitatus]
MATRTAVVLVLAAGAWLLAEAAPQDQEAALTTHEIIRQTQDQGQYVVRQAAVGVDPTVALMQRYMQAVADARQIEQDAEETVQRARARATPLSELASGSGRDYRRTPVVVTRGSRPASFD